MFKGEKMKENGKGIIKGMLIGALFGSIITFMIAKKKLSK